MDISVLYFLMKLYDLLCGYEDKCPNFAEIYGKAVKSTSVDIISGVPDEIRGCAEALNEHSDESSLIAFTEMLSSYAEKCRRLLPDLTQTQQEFTARLSDTLCANGYFFKGGAFRKVRKGRLYIIECELTADFTADSYGRVTGIEASPLCRIADVSLKKEKGFGFHTPSGIDDDDACITDIKIHEPSAFYKTLRHLKKITLDVGEEIKSEQLSALAESACVSQFVCENRAIPHYYKKLCKNDFPFGKAFSAAFYSAMVFFMLLTLISGLFIGIGVYLAMGYEKFYGLFELPYFYVFTAAVSAVYGIFVFKKARSGRF